MRYATGSLLASSANSQKGFVEKNAIAIALAEPFSNGQTENSISDLKMIKRQMYDRVNSNLAQRAPLRRIQRLSTSKLRKGADRVPIHIWARSWPSVAWRLSNLSNSTLVQPGRPQTACIWHAISATSDRGRSDCCKARTTNHTFGFLHHGRALEAIRRPAGIEWVLARIQRSG
jgi:hypothetical protein